jgi:NAD(P)-dependent dehydrogenase (short-subunit alcohol dehydrogenase family)
MDLLLKDKVIIVTGGAKGIGEGIVKVLAKEGALPVIVGRSQEDNQKTAAAIMAEGGKTFQVVAELSDPEFCEKAVKVIVSQFGRIDGLVNNAGVNDGVGLENGNYQNFLSSLHKNVIHYYLMAHHALPELKRQKAHCEHHIQNCRHGPGRHVGLCSIKWRPQCNDKGMGRGITEIWNQGKCRFGSRMLYTFICKMD